MVRFAREVDYLETTETTGTAGTTESIFDTQFRCRLFRLSRLCRLSFSKKQRFLTFTNY